jgi:DNA processing protein
LSKVCGLRVGCEAPLVDPALKWVAVNRCVAVQPGLRRRITGAWREDHSRGALEGARWLEAASSCLSPGWMAEARAEMERARRCGASVLTLADAAYPVLLRAASDPPPLLYVRGRLRPQDACAVAIVGSRRATPHGVDVARRLAGDLAAAGFVVVSGLARGIDAAAHRGALERGGRTIAILGCGPDRIYPSEHHKLAESIVASGALLSEWPCGTPPLKRHFPERNRLIAWMTWATVVVEAARDSGSLITAGLAADEGRSVYAVPGPVGAPGAEGTNGLLREGAGICRGAADVIEDLAPQLGELVAAAAPDLVTAGEGRAAGVAAAGGTLAGRGPAAGLSEAQRLVLRHLPAARGIGLEALGHACRLAPGPLLAALLELEILGLARQLPGRRFMALT